MFAITAALMFLMDRKSEGARDLHTVSVSSALIPGLFQAAALAPGLSRSGACLFGGLRAGYTREFTVKFAFLMSIPVILGATAIELLKALSEGGIELNSFNVLLGCVSAAICGVCSIKCILVLTKKRKFKIFGFYCLGMSCLAFLSGFGIVGV